MEVRAILGLNGLEAIWDGFDGWHLGIFRLGQTRHTNLAAPWACYPFVPLIYHQAHLFFGRFP
jgi:hypothetical protein